MLLRLNRYYLIFELTTEIGNEFEESQPILFICYVWRFHKGDEKFVDRGKETMNSANEIRRKRNIYRKCVKLIGWEVGRVFAISSYVLDDYAIELMTRVET